MLMMLPITNMKLVDTNNTLMGQNVELVLETQFFNMRGFGNPYSELSLLKIYVVLKDLVSYLWLNQ
jgi:hypothetical protein